MNEPSAPTTAPRDGRATLARGAGVGAGSGRGVRLPGTTAVWSTECHHQVLRVRPGRGLGRCMVRDPTHRHPKIDGIEAVACGPSHVCASIPNCTVVHENARQGTKRGLRAMLANARIGAVPNRCAHVRC